MGHFASSRLFVLSLLALGACGAAPTGPDAPDASSYPLTLGANDTSGTFVPFSDGQHVDLVEGAQGGFHVWMRYRASGAVGTRAELQRVAHRIGDGALILRSTSQSTIVDESDLMPMFMCPSPVGISVIDEPMRFELRFVDDDGRPLSTGITTLVPHCPEANREFCLRICTG